MLSFFSYSESMFQLDTLFNVDVEGESYFIVWDEFVLMFVTIL